VRLLHPVVHVCLLSACAMAVAGCHSAARPNSAADEAAIRQWLSDWNKAYEAKDVDAVAALYAPDVVAYDVIPPLQYVGKTAYVKDFKDFLSQVEGPIQVQDADIHIATSGDLAYAAYLQHVVFTTDGQVFDAWGRETSVFRKVDGKWLDIHDHVSSPIDLDTGRAVMDLKP
jgi:uncharacterized protein (TIGR02246 family)